MNRDKDTKDMAAYLKITSDEVRRYSSPDETEKKPERLELIVNKKGEAPEAVNCQKNRGPPKWLRAGDGRVTCTYIPYCSWKSSDVSGPNLCAPRNKRK